MNNLLGPANDLHAVIGTFIKDFEDGDFALPGYAEIHVRIIKEKYLTLGKAIYKELREGPKTFPNEFQ